MSDIEEREPSPEKSISEPVLDAEEEDEDDGLGLFGDDDEEEVGDDVADKTGVDVDEDDEEIEDTAGKDEEDLKTLEISLVRHSKSHHKLRDETIKLQVPTYIGIDPKPFDPTKFEESVHDNEGNVSQELDDKLLAENTIRWRYSTNNEGNVYRQSNTQIIEWEDGSYSLKLGSEIFDVRMKPNEDNFLVMTHDDQDILQTQEILTHVAKIVPTSTSSQVHKRLTKAIANKQALSKQHKMKSIILTEDPELRIKALEKAEEESIKARRRAELKRLQEEEKFERGSPAPSRGARTYYAADDEDEAIDDGIDVRRNEYDEDDGFIDDDDDDEDDGYGDEEDEDELDRAAERLRKVKEAGASKYAEKRTAASAEGDDEDEEAEEDKVTRKKRRVISDDEDED